MSPTIQICSPSPTDAARIADIHLAAMDSNPLLHVQFPTPASLEGLRHYLQAYTISELDDPTKGVLVARYSETNEIISFAKWDLPSTHGSDSNNNNKLETGDIRDIEGCRPEFLEGYAVLAAEAKGRCWGDRACYSLTFVCTDPGFRGMGAGSRLTREVMERARGDGMPVYLESTIVAVRMYERLGFKAVDRFGMRIPGSGRGMEEVYEEVCMVWRPE